MICHTHLNHDIFNFVHLSQLGMVNLKCITIWLELHFRDLEIQIAQYLVLP